jgi:regulator of protease activity HflC (stomatin/prohibitin superfamily)
MVEIGVALVLVGVALLVAEAHVPGGVLGTLGGVVLAGGLALAVAGAGAGLALVVTAVLAAAVVSGLWLAVATRKALATRRLRVSSGREALSGQLGVGRGRRPGPGRRSPLASSAELARRRARAGGGGPDCRGTGERTDPGGTQGGGVGEAMVIALLIALGVVVATVIALAAASVRVLREYERGVVFRLGRVIDQKGPGLVLLIPAIDRMVRVSLRTVTMRIPHQEVITRDNVPVKVAAVVYFRVMDPTRSVVEVEQHTNATLQIAQTTLRSVLGKAELDTLLAERERLNESLQQIIDDQTEPWGIKVSVVEIKDVEIPERMQQAIARQAEAERNRRAKVINAEGEFQAADRLAQAADVIRPNPVTMQLRYLQALTDISSNQASTIVFPLPLDLIKPLVEPRADTPKPAGEKGEKALPAAEQAAAARLLRGP